VAGDGIERRDANPLGGGKLADVQLEHGHLRIARDFFDALLRQRLAGREWTVFMAVLRLTWGNEAPPYQVKNARIGSRKIARLTGIHERDVRAELAKLRRRKMLARKRDGQWYRWGIVKDFDLWRGEVRAQAPRGVDTRGVEARTTAGVEARTSAGVDTPHLKRTEQNRRSANSRARSQSQLSPLGETIRSLRL
jgi:phage replication O-like protein O